MSATIHEINSPRTLRPHKYPAHSAVGARVIDHPLAAEVLGTLATARQGTTSDGAAMFDIAAASRLTRRERAGINLAYLVRGVGTARFRVGAMLEKAFVLRQAEVDQGVYGKNTASRQLFHHIRNQSSAVGNAIMLAENTRFDTDAQIPSWTTYRDAGRVLVMAGIAALNVGHHHGLSELYRAVGAFDLSAARFIDERRGEGPHFLSQLSELAYDAAEARERLADALLDGRITSESGLEESWGVSTAPANEAPLLSEWIGRSATDWYTEAIQHLSTSLTDLALGRSLEHRVHWVGDRRWGAGQLVPDACLRTLDTAITRVGAKVHILGAKSVWDTAFAKNSRYAELRAVLGTPPAPAPVLMQWGR